MFEHVGLPQFPTFFRTAQPPARPRRGHAAARHGAADRGPLQPALHGQVHLPRRLHPRRSPRSSRRWRGRASWSATPRSCRCTTPRPPGNGAAASSPTASRCSSSTTSASSACGSSTSPASESAFRHDAIHVFHLQLARDQARVPLTRAYIPEAMARLAEAELDFPEYAALHDAPPSPGAAPPPEGLSARWRRGRRRPRARW